jgi:hypothetical protein
VDTVEASLLAKELKADGVSIDEATIIRLLNLHGAYVDGKIREAQAAAEAARLEAARTQASQEMTGKNGG